MPLPSPLPLLLSTRLRQPRPDQPLNGQQVVSLFLSLTFGSIFAVSAVPSVLKLLHSGLDVDLVTRRLVLDFVEDWRRPALDCLELARVAVQGALFEAIKAVFSQFTKLELFVRSAHFVPFSSRALLDGRIVQARVQQSAR